MSDYDAFVRRVGQNIRTARHLKGMTLDEATAGRGAYRYLREVETGRRNPSLQTLYMLAEKFGVTVADLVRVDAAELVDPPLLEQEVEGPPVGRKPKTKKRK